MEYDDLSPSSLQTTLDGIPIYMIRKARVVTGSRDPSVLKEFVLANNDQSDDFWSTEQHADEIDRKQSASVLQDAVERLGQAPQAVLESLGVSATSINAAASNLGLPTLSKTVSAPGGYPNSQHSTIKSSGVSKSTYATIEECVDMPLPDDDWMEMPVPDDDDDFAVTPSRRSAKARWTTLRHMVDVTSKLSSLCKAETSSTRSEPPLTVFGELAETITESTSIRDSLDRHELSLIHSLQESGADASGLVDQLDEGDLVEVRLPTKESILPKTGSGAPLGNDWISSEVLNIMHSAGKVMEISLSLQPAKPARLSARRPPALAPARAPVLAIADRRRRQPPPTARYPKR